jgi:lysozyme family protein
MKISDILVSANTSNASADFRKGLSIVLPAECEFKPDGVTIRAERPDSHGLTYAGLNQQDDDLPVDETGTVTATTHWIVQTYSENYWQRVAARLPCPLNWIFFVQAVNEGEGTCVRLLQLALNDLEGAHLVIDGEIGDHTLSAAWAAQNKQALALAFLSQCAARYKFLATTSEVVHDDLHGLLNRVANLKAELTS